MGKEQREKPELTLEEFEAKYKAIDYRKKAAGITKTAGLKGKLGLDFEQIRLFNARFAHALSVKETADNARRKHSGLYIVAERLGIRPYLDYVDMTIEVDKLTSQRLKKSFEKEKSEFEAQEGTPSAYQIANAANFLSSLYVECKEDKTDFGTAVEENIDYLKRQFLKVD